MADFDILDIPENPTGWGPTGMPHDQFKDLPYQPFSKSDKIGKVADWTDMTYQDRRMANKYLPQYGGGGQYAYFQDEDEGYQLVDTTRLPQSYRGRGRLGGRLNQRNMRGGRGGRGQGAGRGMRGQGGRGGPQHQGRGRFQRGGRRYDQRGGPQMKKRDASVYIKNSWKLIDEIDFPRLAKLNFPRVGEPEDLYTAGALEYYDKSYDRCTAKNPKPLMRINRVFHRITTTDDPIIRKLSKTAGKVYATDSIIATLMCASRSVHSWDIVVQRIGDKLFFDKRDDSNFDLLTVNETSAELPYGDEHANSFNSPRNLALEATYINHNFSQQVLRMGEDKMEFEHPNPFVEDEDQDTEVASVVYRYRKFDLGDGLELIVRTENDAATPGPNGETQFMNIKALNEWDPRYSGGIDWRQKLDGQKGAVIGNELKNNSCKLAKWTVQALLAGSDHIKLGYVSRNNILDSSKHVILGTQGYKPREFAVQINLNMDNAWGVLVCIINMFMKMPEGKYLILKDPNKPALLLYDIPDNSFDSDEGEEEEEDEEEEEAGEDVPSEANKEKAQVDGETSKTNEPSPAK